MLIFSLFFGHLVLGLNQAHLSYLGPTSRSISWTSLTTDKPMKMFYKKTKDSGNPIEVMSTVTTFKEPQLANDYRYIHDVVLNNLDFDEYTYHIDSKPIPSRSYPFNVYDWTTENWSNFMIYGDMGRANSECLPAIEERLKTDKDGGYP